MPKVEKVSRRDGVSPCAPSLEGETHRCWKGYSGSVGVMDGIAG